MTDIDELLDILGSDTKPEHRKCNLKGCNKTVATMDEAVETPDQTAACAHCFRIIIPGENDKSPRVIRNGRERKSHGGIMQEWAVTYYEDGTKKLDFIIRQSWRNRALHQRVAPRT